MNEGRGSTTFTNIARYLDETKTCEKINGLKTGEAYRFRVIALNTFGESAPSSPSDEMECSDVPD
jgi:hypothetical protein